ncbi:hypothetical protein SEA_FORZA_61 [Gordonia phage Forza]|uniref:ADP-ribosylglycohydrolase n=1 Tax=Gordonia phage Forza TaxID=2571247 RepID=A0A650EYB7_9CAUD|nr:hypothetical protein PP303_gp061 [Gordonia phage Forza]QEM41531.1 ADP-ribosylglycohydrolase [Gordonia phage Boopy]QGT55054.1 hypothetical protein SEA_FORZA_61 [Gordonia phage Forza]UXE04204.1 ADP-ribosyl glycohydrolase [Gordonia phage BlueNGold]WBF03843.1 ADP-ribosyl glycohydrolase [Gordonia phage Mareelih]
MTTINPALYRNAMIGLAAGDAWGYQVEFTQYKKMPKPVPQPSGEWVVSDDTQMTLALEKAIHALDELGWLNPEHVHGMEEVILAEFSDWAYSPLNTRAPGATCMGSIRMLNEFGRHWSLDALSSAGCGAVMRLLPTITLDDESWRALTALQAVITHNDPAAVASALLLGEVGRAIANGNREPMLHALNVLDEMLNGQYGKKDKFLAKVLDPATLDVPAYIRKGVKDGKLDMAIFSGAHRILAEHIDIFNEDICNGVGQGWDAMTATALAIMVADRYLAGDLTVQGAMEWAVTSNGDSDSIGAIAGMLIGLSSNDDDFWKKNGVDPVFEDVYAGELA